MLRQKIKELRKERNWTQLELAKRSGLDRGYIANLEGSKSVRRPSADAFLKLARTFNIKPEELYEAAGYIKGTNGTHPRPETPEEIIDHLKNVLPRSIPVYLDYPFHAGDGVGQMLQDLMNRAEITGHKASCHVFRHTFANDCLDNGMDPLDLMYLLGHTSLKMVENYSRAHKQRRALKALEKQHPVDRLIK